MSDEREHYERGNAVLRALHAEERLAAVVAERDAAQAAAREMWGWISAAADYSSDGWLAREGLGLLAKHPSFAPLSDSREDPDGGMDGPDGC